MTNSEYTRFLADCITVEPENSGLTEDEMYGVYVSWCLLNRINPRMPAVFWTAMARGGMISAGSRQAAISGRGCA